MTKKNAKLKQLFLFNGLLLVVAFIAIQYSVSTHSENGQLNNESDIATEYQNILNKNEAGAKEAMLTEDFDRFLKIFDEPQEVYNLPFQNIMGKSMTLEDFKGQWVVLNFWATWCPPCVVEMPSLQKLQDSYGGQGVKVIAIALDRQIAPDKLRKFMARHSMGPIAAYYAEWGEVKNNFTVRSIPTTYILSPNGRAVAVYKGPADWGGKDARNYMESLLN